MTAGWESALGSALAGTARQPPAGADGDPEGALLGAAAALAVRRLAGWQPARGALPTGAVCPSEERRAVSPMAALRLAGLLGGVRAELLPEWLELAAAGRLVVPPRLLPALLAHAEGNPPIRTVALDVIGRRGRWLAEQIPNWAFAAVGDPVAAFETGTRPARVAALRELRREDPEAALARLAASWPTESGEDRAALVGGLHVGLGPADEEFLEAATGDSRKEVRQAAVAFLARLPGSRLVGRMRERVAPMVAYRRGLLGGKLQVAPPEACGPELVADGLEPRPPQGTGERAWWLTQVLSLVPPGTWPVEAAASAGATDWEAALLRGWAAATARFGDAGWARALVALWERTPESRRGELGFSPESVLIGLDPSDRDAILVAAIARSPAIGAHLAVMSGQRWGRDLTAALVGALPGLAARAAPLASQLAWQLGRLGDPALTVEFDRVAAATTDDPALARALDVAADTLHWRALMAKELTKMSDSE